MQVIFMKMNRINGKEIQMEKLLCFCGERPVDTNIRKEPENTMTDSPEKLKGEALQSPIVAVPASGVDNKEDHYAPKNVQQATMEALNTICSTYIFI